jgi:predicted phage-related endonuclease
MYEEFQPPEGVKTITTTTEEAWKEERRKGIGGSDLSHFLDEDYGCLRGLAFRKSGVLPDYDDSNNFRFSRGKRQEPIARSFYVEKTGRRTEQAVGSFALRHDEPAYDLVARVNVDGIIYPGRDVETFGVLELKVLGLESFRKYKKQGLPKHYIAQLQWALGTLKLSWGSFAIFSPELDELVYFDISFDKDLYDQLTSLAFDFWRRYMQDSNAAPPEKLDPRVSGVR